MSNEADTCRTYIVPKLHASGWEDDFITEQMVLSPGRIVPIGDRHTRKEELHFHYVLFVWQNILVLMVGQMQNVKNPATRTRGNDKEEAINL
jgi:type I restriction enzyme, R subunit